MRFTRWEFARGAIAGWVWFLGLHQLLLLVPLAGYGVWSLYATIPWSLGALLLGSPAAFALGWAMRRQPKVPWHLLAFASFGLAVGVVATVVALWVPAWGIPADGYGNMTLPAAIVAISASPAVALGWWFTARRALAADRGSVHQSTVTPDEAYEDSV
ncbi:hypothetical protein ACEYYH_17505 [Microbacterium trichothecenolyticum]|uniref:hypothetical protein n=1 Tax=Microbacterium trichothecenolyticum TaxID=69370 RepID=UPI0035BE35E1